jgi:hypothetical protein
MSNEHMGFLDPGHRRGRDTYGDVSDVRQWTALSEEYNCSGPNLPGRAYRFDHVRGAATRTEADDEIVTAHDSFNLAPKGSGIAHIVADGGDQGGVIGQGECQ